MSDSTTPQDSAAMSPASVGSHNDASPLFSERLRLSRLAEEWCDSNRAPHYPLNIVTALFSLGLVSLRPTLTDDERTAIQRGIDELDGVMYMGPVDDAAAIATLRDLLERLP